MYDDYDLDYTFSNDYTLDEDAYYEHYTRLDARDLDDEYARDTQDYDALAYRHYAWYNVAHMHSRTRITCLSHTQNTQYVSH